VKNRLKNRRRNPREIDEKSTRRLNGCGLYLEPAQITGAGSTWSPRE
jgi:hypothetical protein